MFRNDKAEEPNRVSILFSFLMALVYIGLGIFILLRPDKFEGIPPVFRFALGALFIAYGIFRGYRNIRKIRDFTPLLLLPVVLITSCGPENPKTSDTPTTGKITIAVDETYGPILDSEVATFNAHYKHAEIKAIYLPESEAFQALMDDSVRLVVASRKLRDEEREYLRKIPITPREIEIFRDAVAFILHPSNPDSNYTLEQIRNILKGTLPTWKSISANNISDSIRVVFDNKNSSTARFVKDSLMDGGQPGRNCFALTNNVEVIDYVATHPEAIGVIGVNWISDSDDPASQSFLKKVKVMALTSADPMDPEFYKPFQAYLATKKYPLTRTVYIVMREPRTGLGTGFASFVAGDKGQRIILKSGLVPATMPVRIVGFKK